MLLAAEALMPPTRLMLVCRHARLCLPACATRHDAYSAMFVFRAIDYCRFMALCFLLFTRLPRLLYATFHISPLLLPLMF